MQPIIQRAVNFIPLVPFALALRLVVDAAVGVRDRFPEELYIQSIVIQSYSHIVIWYSVLARLTFYIEK